jgi:hypothetical protein
MSEAISGGLLVFFFGFPDIAEPFIRPCFDPLAHAAEPYNHRHSGMRHSAQARNP